MVIASRADSGHWSSDIAWPVLCEVIHQEGRKHQTSGVIARLRWERLALDINRAYGGMIQIDDKGNHHCLGFCCRLSWQWVPRHVSKAILYPGHWNAKRITRELV